MLYLPFLTAGGGVSQRQVALKLEVTCFRRSVEVADLRAKSPWCFQSLQPLFPNAIPRIQPTRQSSEEPLVAFIAVGCRVLVLVRTYSRSCGRHKRAQSFGCASCNKEAWNIWTFAAVGSVARLGQKSTPNKIAFHGRSAQFSVSFCFRLCDWAEDLPSECFLIVNASARPPRLAGLPTAGTGNY